MRSAAFDVVCGALRRLRTFPTVSCYKLSHRCEDRTADVFANWLRHHPGVEVIVRDAYHGFLLLWLHAAVEQTRALRVRRRVARRLIWNTVQGLTVPTRLSWLSGTVRLSERASTAGRSRR